MKKRLLLHTCCGPCAAWPLLHLSEKSPEIGLTGFFYNPNIHPRDEWRRRADSAEKLYGQHAGVPLLMLDDYMEREWTEHCEAGGSDGRAGRCAYCYGIRISRAAREARRGGYDAFSTTLLISPYQNHELITKICGEQARQNGVAFYYRDFRPHFREGQNIARELGLYRQKYCGCVFSR